MLRTTPPRVSLVRAGAAPGQWQVHTTGRGSGGSAATTTVIRPLSTSKYTGFIANDLKGADISFFIGLPVAGILYSLFGRTIDVAAETEVAQREQAAAEAHRRPDE